MAITKTKTAARPSATKAPAKRMAAKRTTTAGGGAAARGTAKTATRARR